VWVAVLFFICLALLLVGIALGVMAILRPGPGLRRARDIAFLASGVALVALFAERALNGAPFLWGVAALLLVGLFGIAPMMVQQWRKDG
jgi:uncharacterized membrane protein